MKQGVEGYIIETSREKVEKRQSEWERFWREEEGVGIIELILILVILIGVVVIFRSQITTIIQDAFKSITGGTEEINEEIPLDEEE